METKIIKHLVTTYVNKRFRNPEKRRNFLIDCIESNGYIKQPETRDLEEEEDLYQYMIPNQNENENQNESGNGNEIDFKLSLQEQEQSSVDRYGFNRTFIALNSRDSDKLNILQKRGITYEETQFNKVKEQMENILQEFESESDTILNTALNIYINLLLYYKDNPYGFTEIKGSLKRGYIFLSLYYAFRYNNVSISKQDLLKHSPQTRLGDLPLADKNMKMIFKQNFNFNVNLTFNLNLNLFPVNISKQKLLTKIENVIEQTSEIIPSTKLGLYAIVYYICNDYYPFKVKIIYKDRETAVTYSVLNELIEPFSSSTVRKLTDKLRTL
jgi:hypothetical protein